MATRASLVLAFVFLASACQDKPKAADPPPTAAKQATAALKEGDPAPDVEMTLQDGRKLRLSSLKGQMVAIYFYPKDETTGCTIEAQNFRDRFADLKAAGITVIGVSAQDAASHKKFIDKEHLPFDLAIDSDMTVAKAFGVPSIANGAMHARWTVLVDKDGKVKKIWKDVDPNLHADAVLAAAKA